MNKSVPKYLIFDVVGTLIYPSVPVGKTYFQIGSNFGSRLAEGEIANRFREQFHQQFVLESSKPTDDADQKRRWKILVESVFDDVAQIDELFQKLWDYYSTSTSWQVYEDVSSNWRYFESKGYRICLASNFDERLFRIISQLEPLQRAQHVFCSSRIGYEKPSLKFFRAIESTLGAGVFTMVGDDRENDVEGPRRCGWQAIWLDRKLLARTDQAISSLQDLIDILK